MVFYRDPVMTVFVGKSSNNIYGDIRQKIK